MLPIRELLADHLECQVAPLHEGKFIGAGPIYAEDAEDPKVVVFIMLAARIAQARALADADHYTKRRRPELKMCA